jgi:hypothetical protein
MCSVWNESASEFSNLRYKVGRTRQSFYLRYERRPYNRRISIPQCFGDLLGVRDAEADGNGQL